MTNEEMCLDALNLCKKTRIFIPSNEILDIAINSILENTKLKDEIERLNTQIAESKAEGVGILYNILELREENKWLEERVS